MFPKHWNHELVLEELVLTSTLDSICGNIQVSDLYCNQSPNYNRRQDIVA